MEPARLETIDDGRLLEVVNQKLQEAMEHVLRHPENLGKRKVTLTLEMTPVPDRNSGQLYLDFKPKVTGVNPVDETMTTRALLVGGEFQVSSIDPREPRQMGLYENVSTIGGKA
jgi:hypothetical protein